MCRLVVGRTCAALLLASLTVIMLGALASAFADVPGIPNIRCPDGQVIPNDGRPCPESRNGGSGGNGAGSTSSTGASPESIAIAIGAGALVLGVAIGTIKRTRTRGPVVERVPRTPHTGTRAPQLRIRGRGSYLWETPDPPPDLRPAPLIGDSAAIPQRLYTGTVSVGSPDPPPAPNTIADAKAITPDPTVAFQHEIEAALRALEQAFARGDISPQEFQSRTEALHVAGGKWKSHGVEIAAGVGGAAAGYAATTGNKSDNERFCTGCGIARDPRARFCRKCGAGFS